jgi:3-phenylpropionate/cinnamic acid dioxygenase small subunit
MKKETFDNRLKEKNALALNSANSPFEEQQAILDLIYKYSYSYDSKNLKEFLSLFTSDCVWEVYMDRGVTLVCQATNRKELAIYIAKRLEDLKEKGVQSRHYQTNTILNPISAKEVEAVTMLNLLWQYPENQSPTSYLTGVYKDVIVNIQGEWKFAKRTALIDQKQ